MTCGVLHVCVLCLHVTLVTVTRVRYIPLTSVFGVVVYVGWDGRLLDELIRKDPNDLVKNCLLDRIPSFREPGSSLRRARILTIW